jgi:hypothetical protein
MLAGTVVSLVAAAAGLHAVRYIRFDNDGMRYALVSTQILRGRGITTPATLSAYRATFPRFDSFGNTPATWQPPLLPAVYALLGGVLPGRLWPAQAVNLFAHILTAVLAFSIARRLGGTLAGLGAGLPVALSYPLLDMDGRFWSEPLFIAMFTASIRALQAARDGRQRARFEIRSGLAAAAACATRWMGISLAPMLLWNALRAIPTIGLRAALRSAAYTMVPSFAITALLFTRNYLLDGTFRGAVLAPTGRGWGEVARGVVSNYAELFDLQVPGARVAAAFALCAMPVLGMILMGDAGREARRLFRRGLDLVLLALFGYVVMIACAYRGGQPYFETRIAAPIIPLIWIAVAAVMAGGWHAIGEKAGPRLAAAGFAGTILLIGAAEAERSGTLLPRTPPSGDYGFESAFCQWAVAHHPPGSVLMTDAPFMVSFFGDIPTVSPSFKSRGPTRSKDPPAGTEEALVQDMRRFNARYLLMLRVVDGLCREEWGDSSRGLPADVWGDCIAMLSRGEFPSDRATNSWTWWRRGGGSISSIFRRGGISPPSSDRAFTRVFQCPLGVVYELKDGPRTAAERDT